MQTAISVVAAAAVLMMVMASPPSLITPGSAPPNVPQPGEIGGLGGGLPTDLSNPFSSLAVALVNDDDDDDSGGLAGVGTPVAVFPPFATPRTLPAIAVIFTEAPIGRKKRDTYKLKPNIKYALMNSPIVRIYTTLTNMISSLMTNFMNNLHCLQPRLYRKFSKKGYRRKPYHNMYSRQGNENVDTEEDQEMNSLGEKTYK